MGDAEDPASPLTSDQRQRVLARKYRPTTLSALIGQDALVRTLSNAFKSGRVAQAYMLSGVRGVGKTTTARIIARALNCVGADGQSGATTEPCGVCPNCVAIADDRHLDVIEMDAASHTGVDNIRDLLDGVPYRPTTARYKVYIIDEVHMLSEKAFNALLKTLEEPPAHVKFIFATTEIRKVPVTVLSRCQRFDLRRVDIEVLAAHLERIARQEGATVTEAATRLIARAAEGSVRDSLSLLDQAIAHGEGTVDETAVQDMLGLADRSTRFDILEAVMQGDVPSALAQVGQQFRAGADPLLILDDLLDLTHWLTRLKLTPESGEALHVPETERVRGRQIAERLSIADLSTAWQMLLKGLGEARGAPDPLQAVEMVLIRLAYTATLPSPADALRALAGERSPEGGPAARSAAAAAQAGPAVRSGSPDQGTRPSSPQPTATKTAQAASALDRRPLQTAEPAVVVPPAEPVAAASPSPPQPKTFRDVVDLARDRREGILYGQLMADVHLVRFDAGAIEIRLADAAAADIPQKLSRFLSEATGVRWLVTISHEAGERSLRQCDEAERAAELAEVSRHPLVEAALATFPGATIAAIRRVDVATEPPAETPPEEPSEE